MLRIALVTAIGAEQVASFCKQLQQELAKLKVEVEFLPAVDLAKVTRTSLEIALNKVNTLSPQLVLGFFADSYHDDHDERKDWDESVEEDNTPTYQHFKALTIGQGLPSQVIYASTLAKPAALNNIVLGILGKTGSIPYVLATPLPYADMVVGIDIVRRRKERLAGTINAVALARIYASNGDFLRYTIQDAPLEGETIPSRVLQSLFPISDFSGKRVVVHRDGYFRGDEKKALKAWGTQIGTEFLLVEIIKTGAPRLYAAEPTRKNNTTSTSDTTTEIRQPPKGSILFLSDYEALVVSSLPPFANATPQPLQLRTEAPFTIAEAIHSVLTLTLLHYGAVNTPRLPVTIHYSDKIAYLALNGSKPKNLEGNVPYWL
jgi:argonaute-like protein implicated in RNA metabolism and viral defense